MERLVGDTQQIISWEATLFGGKLPYSTYDLLLHVSPRGRGGLEHRSSSALIVPGASFASRDGYLDLLSLVAHEVFHAWNIKRIRPEGLTPYRYDCECYTRLLWWFRRSHELLRLACPRAVRTSLGRGIPRPSRERGGLPRADTGRRVLSLEAASFDAWIELYRPDEDTLE